VDLTDNNDDDERDIDIVHANSKEETILQNLLHKRSLNNQRVITLEHKNGRKLRVILPPDSQSAKSFVDEAKKSHWMSEMLCSDVHKKGRLM